MTGDRKSIIENGKSKAVFIDRDGTLIEEVNFLHRVEDLRYFPFTDEAVRLLKERGFLVVLVTNQSGISRGIYTVDDMHAVHERIQADLTEKLDAIYFCPHLPEGTIEKYSFACDCRKPAAGMLLQAAREHQIDLENSWLIGDSPKDAEAGRRADCRTILLDSKTSNSDFAAKNLNEAAQIILNQAL